MSDKQAPTAYSCVNGEPPPGCSLLPVWSYWKGPGTDDYIEAFFLLDTPSYEILVSRPPFDHRWRILKTGQCEYAVYRSPCPGPDGRLIRYKLNEEVFKLAGKTVPEGYFVGFKNRDQYDCRTYNLCLIPIPADKRGTSKLPLHVVREASL